MGSSDHILRKLEADLSGCLEIKWQRSLSSVVGINVPLTPSGFSMHQEKLLRKVAERFWDGASTAAMPLPLNFEAIADPAGDAATSRNYLQIVMTLSYLAVGTQPDMSFAVNCLARYSAAPGVSHWKALRHLVNFVMGSWDKVLCIHPNESSEPLQCYVDASWGGQYSKSTYGVFITFFGCPVFWASRRLASIAASTCQAEFMAMGIGTRQPLWICNLLSYMLATEYTIHLKCDNQSAIHIGTDDSSNRRSRHIEREFFIVNEAIFARKACVSWVTSASQIADILTKNLSTVNFQRLSRLVLNAP